MKDPEKGFQRIVRQERAQEIADRVLNKHRTFPNSIVLATDAESFRTENEKIIIPNSTKFLVIDGQHRLWAQKFSEFEAFYCCMIHMGLTEPDMARLFLEINDNQRRVPSSLRWDLLRLIEPEEGQAEVTAAGLTYELATNRLSPLFQRIDLTGEQPGISLKQGSIAPEIRTIVASAKSPLSELDFESQFDVLVRYFAAIKSADSDAWKTGDSPLYQARIVRGLIRVLPEIIQRSEEDPMEISPEGFRRYLGRLKLDELNADRIRAVQGSAGVTAIYRFIRNKMFRG